VRGDFSGGGGFAEARDVLVFRRRRFGCRHCLPPRVIGARDLGEIGLGQLAVDAVDEGA
jgi:hypothetical protein